MRGCYRNVCTLARLSVVSLGWTSGLKRWAANMQNNSPKKEQKHGHLSLEAARDVSWPLAKSQKRLANMVRSGKTHMMKIPPRQALGKTLVSETSASLSKFS